MARRSESQARHSDERARRSETEQRRSVMMARRLTKCSCGALPTPAHLQLTVFLRIRTMAIAVAGEAPTVFIRRKAYERSGLSRATLDTRLGLTPDEFRVEGGLVAIGPIPSAEGDLVADFIAELEAAGLTYFDDFFELSGNWPS